MVRFAVIGDSGTGDTHQHQIARQMLAWHERLPFNLVLMLGDNLYGAWWGGGNKKYFEEKFDRPYAELLARGVIFRAALGNHDVRRRDGQDLIEAYERFHIEGPQGYYSFTAREWHPTAGAGAEPARPAGGHLFQTEKGAAGAGAEVAPLVEFFVLNTTRLEKDKQDPEQLAWLERALAASRARWRIVYGHHPIYSTGKRHGADVELRAKLEPLFLGIPAAGARLPDGQAAGLNKNQKQRREAAQVLSPVAAATGSETRPKPKVHVVLAGHDHLYQRFHPQNGIVYFVCGSSGQLRRGNARPSSQVAAVEDRQRAFMLWEATPEELRFRAINEQGQAFDCGIIRARGEMQSVACEALGPAAQTGMSAPPR